MKKLYFLFISSLCFHHFVLAQRGAHLSQPLSESSVFLRSSKGFHGPYAWEMIKAGNISDKGETISMPAYQTKDWQSAIVPGTVLNSLVANNVYPDPYDGDNNRKSRKLIPDIADAGGEFYHYWFRTKFSIPPSFTGKHLWLKFHGINYRCEIWMNGHHLGTMAGMFNTQNFDITKYTNPDGRNVLAVDIQPVDFPGSDKRPVADRPGAIGENHNGGDGEIGKNVSMLMSVGWDFTSPDGIRDRNTGIWRDVELYATGDVTLSDAFVQSKIPLPDTSLSRETISVEVKNVSDIAQSGELSGRITQTNIVFSQFVKLAPHETKIVFFKVEDYPQLRIHHPKLWWPINKGAQHLYELYLKYTVSGGAVSQTLNTRFGIREVTSDQHTPDQSRKFYINGQPIFIRGTNWVPEAMLRNSEERTYAELRYTKQAGVNLLRLWGGGIAESDYFYQLCDEFGFLVWNEFWITGDTRSPADTSLYLSNLASTIKRIRNHPSIGYYVASNEGNEVPGTRKLLQNLDPGTGYQVQSECCGIHDGSPYKYENPMQYFENTASRRGSRVDGFNPEYGTPCVPIVESLRKMMPENQLWPIADSVWNYLDGNGFHQVTTRYRQAVDEFGQSSSIEEFAQKAQFVGALNFRAIWEVWNYNKFEYGDRFASGFLFWYHNSPLPQTASRMYDWYLEPTAALYYSQNGLAPLHPQFDYLKNTVSVYNDYRKAFTKYQVESTVYNLNSQPVWTKTAIIDIPADGVVNDAIKINFPDNISQVHFIKLRLKDQTGKVVADAFYWRSKDRYEGAYSLTGPAVSGFGEMNKLPVSKLTVRVTKTSAGGKNYLRVTVSNPSRSLSFFTQLKLQDGKGNNLSPAYYSDNFFSLLPGEQKTVTIEAPSIKAGNRMELITDAFNAPATKLTIRN